MSSDVDQTMPDLRPIPLLQGTLDMLMLRTLIFGPRHGDGIAVTIQRTSNEDLLVDHGSLYPARLRLERQGLLKSTWGTSELNRQARFCELTCAGLKKLAAEQESRPAGGRAPRRAREELQHFRAI